MASVSSILRIITDVMDKIDPENRSTLPILLDKPKDPAVQKKFAHGTDVSTDTSESSFEQTDSTKYLKDLDAKDKTDHTLLGQRYTNDKSCLKQTRSISPTALDQPSGELSSQTQEECVVKDRKSVSFHSVVQVRVRDDFGFVAQRSPTLEEKRLAASSDFEPHPNVSTYSLLGNMKENMILKGESYFRTELFKQHFAELKAILSQPYANLHDLQSAVAPLLAIFAEKLEEASPPMVMFSNLRAMQRSATTSSRPARQRSRSFMDLDDGELTDLTYSALVQDDYTIWENPPPSPRPSVSRTRTLIERSGLPEACGELEYRCTRVTPASEDEPKCSFPTLSCVVS